MKSHLEQSPISPFTVYDKYRLKCLTGKECIRRSKTIQKSYDLANSALRSQLLMEFLKVKDAQDALRWVQRYGFLEEHEKWNGPSKESTSVLTFPMQTFFQALASSKWIMKFACAVKATEETEEIEQDEESDYSDSFRSWLKPRENIGNYSRAIFEPNTNEIPHFEYIVDQILLGKSWYCTNLDEESLCIASKEKLFNYPLISDNLFCRQKGLTRDNPLTKAFWEDVRRWKLGSNFTDNSATNQPTRSNFEWLAQIFVTYTTN